MFADFEFLVLVTVEHLHYSCDEVNEIFNDASIILYS